METGDIIALVISGISLFLAVSGGKRTSDHDVADHAHWQGRVEEKLDNIGKNTTHMRDDIKGLNVKFDNLSHRVTSVEHKVEAHGKQIDGIWDQMKNDAEQATRKPPPTKEDK